MDTLNIIPEEQELQPSAYNTTGYSSRYSDYDNALPSINSNNNNYKLSIIHEDSEQHNFQSLGSSRGSSVPPRQPPPPSPSISNSNMISRSNSSSYNSNAAGPSSNSVRNNGGIQIKQISSSPFSRTNSKIHSDPGSQATGTSVSFPTFKHSSIVLEDNLAENLSPEGVNIVNRPQEFYYHNDISQPRNRPVIRDDDSRIENMSRQNTSNEYNYIYGGRMKSFKRTQRRNTSFFSTASASKRFEPLHKRIRDYESSISTLESKQVSLKRSNKTYFFKKANVWRVGFFKKFKAKCKSWKLLIKKNIRERRQKIKERRNARALSSKEINDLFQNDDPLREKFREKRVSRDQKRFSSRFVGSMRRKLSILSSNSFRRQGTARQVQIQQQQQQQQQFGDHPESLVRLTAENIELFSNGYKPVKDNLKKYMEQIEESGNSVENIDLMEEIESGADMNHDAGSLQYSNSTKSSRSIHSGSSISSSVYSEEILTPNYQIFEKNWNLYLKQLVQQKTARHLMMLSNHSAPEQIDLQTTASAKDNDVPDTRRFSTLEEILPNYTKNSLSYESLDKVVGNASNCEINLYIEDMKIYTQALSENENLISFSSSSSSIADIDREDQTTMLAPTAIIDTDVTATDNIDADVTVTNNIDDEVPDIDDVESLSSKTTIQSSNSSIDTNLHSESQYYSVVNTDDDNDNENENENENENISIDNEKLDEIIKNLEKSNTVVIHKLANSNINNSNSFSSSNSLKLTRIGASPVNNLRKAGSLTRIIISDEKSLPSSPAGSLNRDNNVVALSRKPSSIRNQRRVASNNIIRFLSLRNAGFSDDDSDVELVELANKDGPRKIESVIELSRKSSSIASSIEITPFHTLKKSPSAASEIRSSLKIMNI